MPIRAAIFDCDGTLVDSMPMWTDTCVRLLERYGVADARRVFAEHESLDMDKKCYWYHDNLGIGESGEALYRELWHMVEHEYRHSVRAFAGAGAFLEQLYRAGIPMVVASSTPTELLRTALRAQGLERYFSHLVFAGDVGRGKEHPDVYLAACELLGARREETWVFEDAPFGVRSAVRAGFPTVAVVNDHDGRDEAFLRRWATVVAHGYKELTPQTLDPLGPRITCALVVAGSPESSSAALVARLAHDADYVVAADCGAKVLREAGVLADLMCGDEDSADEQTLRWVRETGIVTERHPREKDDTDLGLAIGCARREADRRASALRLVVTCATGGRPDHALGVWGVLAKNADVAPRVEEDGLCCRLLSPTGDATWELRGRLGSTLSALALAEGTVVSERGTQWELERESLGLLDDRGVSNVIVSHDACVCCHAGVLAVFCLR